MNTLNLYSHEQSSNQKFWTHQTTSNLKS